MLNCKRIHGIEAGELGVTSHVDIYQLTHWPTSHDTLSGGSFNQITINQRELQDANMEVR